MLPAPAASFHPRRPRQASGDFRKRRFQETPLFSASLRPLSVPACSRHASYALAAAPQGSVLQTRPSHACACAACRARQHLEPVETPGAEATCPGHTHTHAHSHSRTPRFLPPLPSCEQSSHSSLALEKPEGVFFKTRLMKREGWRLAGCRVVTQNESWRSLLTCRLQELPSQSLPKCRTAKVIGQ